MGGDIKHARQGAHALDARRWTPKYTLFVQKAYQLDVSDTFSFFLGGGRVKFSIIINNLTENLVLGGYIFEFSGGGGKISDRLQ